jgi:hypothetical protein
MIEDFAILNDYFEVIELSYVRVSHSLSLF